MSTQNVHHHQQAQDQRYHPKLNHPGQHHLYHARADSAGVAAGRSMLGSRAASGNESPLAMRPWRGPGRQLSLEILPSSRTGSFGSSHKPSLLQNISTGSIPKTSQVSSTSSSTLHTPVFENPQAAAHYTTSPTSTGNDGRQASPPYAESEASADLNDASLTSGRTTPSQLVRSVADVRIQPWSYGSVVTTTREHELLQGSGSRKPDQNASNTSLSRNTPQVKDRPSTSANTTSSSEWTSERVFVSSGARGNRHVHVGVQTPQSMPYSFPNPVNTVQHHRRDESPSAQQHAQSARAPRRDWDFEGRARRDERLGRSGGGIGAGGSGTQSPAFAGNLSSADEEEEDDFAETSGPEDAMGADDHGWPERQRHGEQRYHHQHSHSLSGNSNNITALPQPPKTASSSKKSGSSASRHAATASMGSSKDERPMSERPLLERMIFKKRK